MDVTPQVINEVEFHQKMRGYDPDEVDDFLEKVAVAVGQLHDRLRDAAERVSSAERRAAEAVNRLEGSPQRAPAALENTSPSIEEEAETIRRTLVLAQRTADAAIKEAEETAQRTVAAAQEEVAKQRLEAQANARQLIDDAEEKSRKLVDEAEQTARRNAEDARQALVAEIVELEESRDALRGDTGILERHLDEQRLRLRSSVAELQRLLDDPERLRMSSMPQLADVNRPSAVAEALVADGTSSSIAGEDEVIDLDAPPIPVEGVSWPTTGGVTFTSADDSEPSEDEAWARFVGEDGPPTQAIDLGDEDAYLTELRKAMIDDVSDEFGEPALADRQRSRFGRRR